MLRCAAIFRWSPRICVSVMLDRHHWTDFQDPGLRSISVALPLKAQVITEARSKSPRTPRRGTWKSCCWKRSGSPAEQAPEEAPNATGQRGKERHSLSLLSSQEVCGDHVLFLFPNSPLRAQTPLLLWRGSDGNSSQVSQLTAKRTHWMAIEYTWLCFRFCCLPNCLWRHLFLVRWRFPRAEIRSREPDEEERWLDLGLVQPTREQPTKVWNFKAIFFKIYLFLFFRKI